MEVCNSMNPDFFSQPLPTNSSQEKKISSLSRSNRPYLSPISLPSAPSLVPSPSFPNSPSPSPLPLNFYNSQFIPFEDLLGPERIPFPKFKASQLCSPNSSSESAAAKSARNLTFSPKSVNNSAPNLLGPKTPTSESLARSHLSTINSSSNQRPPRHPPNNGGLPRRHTPPHSFTEMLMSADGGEPAQKFPRVSGQIVSHRRSFSTANESAPPVSEPTLEEILESALNAAELASHPSNQVAPLERQGSLGKRTHHQRTRSDSCTFTQSDGFRGFSPAVSHGEGRQRPPPRHVRSASLAVKASQSAISNHYSQGQSSSLPPLKPISRTRSLPRTKGPLPTLENIAQALKGENGPSQGALPPAPISLNKAPIAPLTSPPLNTSATPKVFTQSSPDSVESIAELAKAAGVDPTLEGSALFQAAVDGFWQDRNRFLVSLERHREALQNNSFFVEEEFQKKERNETEDQNLGQNSSEDNCEELQPEDSSISKEKKTNSGHGNGSEKMQLGPLLEEGKGQNEEEMVSNPFVPEGSMATSELPSPIGAHFQMDNIFKDEGFLEFTKFDEFIQDMEGEKSTGDNGNEDRGRLAAQPEDPDWDPVSMMDLDGMEVGRGGGSYADLPGILELAEIESGNDGKPVGEVEDRIQKAVNELRGLVQDPNGSEMDLCLLLDRAIQLVRDMKRSQRNRN